MQQHRSGPKLKCAALILALSGALTTTSLQSAETTGYLDNGKAKAFIDEMSGKGFELGYLQQLIGEARRQESILKAISRPAEKRLNWGEYRKIFLGRKRVDQGVAFWKKHTATLQRASEKFGVAPEIIVAIIGVETRYGRHAGSYRVLDALATLSFDYPPRSKFFTGQLKEFLYLLREEKLPAMKLKGSYAGAMGYGQFIPSSYRAYAVDFDGDGQRDILSNPVDAIGSVANYFRQHGWKTGEDVTLPASVAVDTAESTFSTSLKPKLTLADWKAAGISPQRNFAGSEKELATAMKLRIDDREEHWLGLHNFYVITRYNHSRLYAMAVYQLSREILARHSGTSG